MGVPIRHNGPEYNERVATLTFQQARACVLSHVMAERALPEAEDAALLSAAGRILAEPIYADRDYPPLPRSVRDGYAVRAADLPGELFPIGEVRAGQSFSGEVHAREAVEIMTGAPMPEGADSVVMVEHTSVVDGKVRTDRSLRPGENVNSRGSEGRAGEVLLQPGRRLGFADIALLAMVGLPKVRVYRQPEIAILSTGDELVEVEETPLDYQIRNSNSQALAAQVANAGARARILPIARDLYDATRELIEQALRFDLLLLSGGVSAGKYDIVEKVLADVGAEFYFDRVLIQPGQPLVFGRARGKFFFGLPGNPGSTMLTFEVFARAAIELLGGQSESSLPILWGRLTKDVRQKTGLTRFLPAQVCSNGTDVTPLPWAGSSDIAALARANAFVVTDPERESWAAGDPIRVLLK